MRFSSIVQRIHNDSVSGWAVHSEARQAEARGEDVIILSIGDPDFATPEPIIDAAVAALRAGDTHYAPIEGRQALRAAVAADLRARTGVDLSCDNVLICAGTQNALMVAGLAVAEHGDEIIGLDPMYLTYEATLRMGGAQLLRVPQTAQSGFRPDIDAIASAITDRTRAIMITTPNNPTGVVLTPQELSAIAQLAIKHDLWVISDEVYADLTFDSSHTSMLAIDEMAERTITVSSLSKSHAMTGWRAGWVVGPRPLMGHLNGLQLNVQYGLPGFIQQAALAAMTEYRSASLPMRDIYRRRRDRAADVLAQSPHLDVLVPEAGMYLLVDTRRVSPNAADFTRQLFDQYRVSVIDASAFGQPTQGWVRVSFTIDDDRLAEGCQRIVDFAAQLVATGGIGPS